MKNPRRKVLNTNPNKNTQPTLPPFQMQPCMQLHVHQFLANEQQRLSNLDKNTAKKIISHAQSSLLNFMKSRAKVNCLQLKQNDTHIRAPLTHKVSPPQQIFDSKKLEEHIQKQQKTRPREKGETGPLVECTLRQVLVKEGGSRQKLSRMALEKAKQEYVSLSRRRKPQKIYL